MTRRWTVLALTTTALLALPVGAPAATRCGDPSARPWCDTARTPQERTRLLLGAMTLGEKLSLMAGDDAGGVLTGTPATGTSLGVPRLGIPTLYHSDGPFGPREGKATAMPSPLALAASFDPALAREDGAVIADEVARKGNDLVHAPTVDLMRTPLAGRTFEGYGEDPLLSARTAVGFIDGVQARGVIANVKHFAPNSQEGALGVPPGTGLDGSRFLVDARIDERTLRETYLPPFEAAVRDAHVGSVMCAYGRVNGDFGCASRHLLGDVLRGDWGFDGFVVSDYAFALKSTAPSVNAGTDVEMPVPVFYNPVALRAALAARTITPATIDRRVGAILATMFRFGVFDRPAFPSDDASIDKPAHATVAQRVEESGAVLLSNRDQTLPLDPARVRSLAVIGSVATRYKGGGGSSNVQPFAFRSPLDALRDRAGDGVDLRYADGTDVGAAAAAARGADAAVVFVEDFTTEGTDKPCLALRCAPFDPVSGKALGPIGLTDPDAVVDAVAAANPRTIVVLETGGPVLTPWADRVGAVLEAWYPGQDGGPALARILYGDTDAGGRLPVTFPAKDGDWPTANSQKQYPGVGFRAEHSEGVLIGYRHYDAKGIAPRWPFGHGLSYTDFALSGLRVEAGADATASVLVRNVGRRAGTTVVQAYLGLPQPSAGVVQPPRALKAFRRVTLAAGQARRVRLALDPRAFQYWSTGAGGWRTAPGCYRLSVGFSSRDLPAVATIGRGRVCDGALVLPLDAGAPCTPRRVVSWTLPAAMAGARVRLAGRTVRAVRRGGRLRLRVDLRRLRAGRAVVVVHGRTAAGRGTTQTRVLTLCG